MKAIFGLIVIVIVIVAIFGVNFIYFLGVILVFAILYGLLSKKETLKSTAPKNMLRGVLIEKSTFATYNPKINEAFDYRNFAFIDFETAHKERCSAIQLGVTTVKNGLVETREWFFKPYRTSFDKDFMFTYLHGIKPADVINEKTFVGCWPEIENMIEGCTLVAHNAVFDVGILDYMFKEKLNNKTFNYKYICTLEIARRFLKNDTDKFSMERICYNLDLPYGHHNGKEDSLSCYYLLNRILNHHLNVNTNVNYLLRGKKW